MLILEDKVHILKYDAVIWDTFPNYICRAALLLVHVEFNLWWKCGGDVEVYYNVWPVCQPKKILTNASNRVAKAFKNVILNEKQSTESYLHLIQVKVALFAVI